MSKKLLAKGQIIAGRYEIKNFIAEGGMQQVYRANDNRLARMVALKVPKVEAAERRFKRSAVLSAKVTHPNVAKTLDYFEDDEKGYLIEELLDGVDLKAALAEFRGRIDPHKAAHVLHFISKALAAVHAVGVIHRDLKPTNIMVSSDCDLAVVKITDFGIAKMTEVEFDKEELTMTGSKTVIGALPYMAPELIKKESPGAPADVWSVGAMLYEMLTGEKPFGTGLAAVENIVKGHIPDKPKLLSAKKSFEPVTTELWNIMTQCLQVDVNARPTAAELVKQCGNLCYSSAPRREGYIETYPVAKLSAGFIRISDTETAFFHRDSYYGDDPQVGQKVVFSCSPGDPCARAFPVIPRIDDI